MRLRWPGEVACTSVIVMPAIPTASSASRIADARSGDVTTLSNVMMPAALLASIVKGRERDENGSSHVMEYRLRVLVMARLEPRRGQAWCRAECGSLSFQHAKTIGFRTNRQMER